MFAARLIVGLFAVLLAWIAGQRTSDDGGIFLLLFFGGSLLFIYFLPTFEAWLRKHPDIVAIGVLNLFLGWSFLGWVIALVWAFKRFDMPTMPPDEPLKLQRMKACPMCAEEILAAAVKCKHCGSAVRV